MKKAIFFFIFGLFIFLTACGLSESTKKTSNGHHDESEYRMIKHAMGEIAVPPNPEKISTLSVLYNDYLLSLGVKPTATVSYNYKGNDHLPYLKDDLTDVHLIGSQDQPNLEKLLELSPDLILGEESHIKSYESFNKIAPTVIIEKTDDWRGYLRSIANVLGRESKAEEVIHNYNQKAEKARVTLNKRVGDKTVVFLRVRSKELRVYGAAWNVGDVLYKDLGLKPASCVPLNDWAKQVSQEVLPQCNPDYILLQVDNHEQAQNVFEDLKSSSIWKNLKAVKNGNVIPVEHWFIMTGPISNETKIDLLINQLK